MSQTFDLLLEDCRLPDREGLVDLGIRGGRIAALGSLASTTAKERLPVGGRLVLPGLVEAHIHLDKALLWDRAPSREGSLAEAIRVTGEAKRRFTVGDIRQRARTVLDLAVAHGTTAMRSHVEVDPIVELMGVEALLPLKVEYAPALDLQLCAFAQEGIIQSPGTEDLLREALRMGADLVGGCPYNDSDARAHIEIVFSLAKEFNVDVDFHLDFADEPEHLHIRDVAELTQGYGWQGRVAGGHLTELAALAPEEQDSIIRLIKTAGVGVIALPATDLYLMGRRDSRNVRRGLTPVKRLLAAGVPVAAASNNIQNAFTPVGNSDLALMGYLLAVAAHMGSQEEISEAVAMLTTYPAQILRLDGYGLAVGCRADLTVWEAERVEQVVTALPPRRWVLKGGRVTVEHTRETQHRWKNALTKS